MSNADTINELQEFRALALLLADKAAQAMKKLQPVSTGSSKKKAGLTPEQKAQLIARRHKQLNRSK